MVSPSTGLSSAFRRHRRGYLSVLGRWGSALRSLPVPSRLISRLIGESDDFRPQHRLWWWSFGAFDEKGQLEGNQYLAGFRAPPLLHQ